MKITNGYKYLGTPFSVECEKINNGDGYWQSTKISVFNNGIFIGEYIRNFDRYDKETFYPFCIDTQWYALYSANYTCTRVLRLNADSIEDWCGEEKSSIGFCPTDMYVPSYKIYGNVDVDDRITDAGLNNEEFKEFHINENAATESGNFLFGFISGCVWGDDSSWKLKYLDLSKIPDKTLVITERFGYFELPHRYTLRQSISSIDYYDQDEIFVSLMQEKQYRLA